MLTMDIFRTDPFSAISLTGAIDRYGYVPGYLGSIPNLIQDTPIRTTDVWVEERQNAPVLIQTTPRGAPPKQVGADYRRARAFRTIRLADASRIYSEELQNIRAFGEESELKQLQTEVARRQMKIKQNFDLTHENMRFGMVQGLVVDADGSVINNWFDEFGQVKLPDVTFKFTKPTTQNPAPIIDGAILLQTNAIRRAVMRGLQGVGGAGVEVHGICSDSYWDNLTTSAEVRDTYRFQMNANALQNNVGGAWESFRYGQIMFHNYRGTDDGTTLAIPDGQAKFFPVNAGIFQRALAPAERFEFVNTIGQAEYSWTVPDRDRDMFCDIEVFSYPLYICTMPQALVTGVTG